MKKINKYKSAVAMGLVLTLLPSSVWGANAKTEAKIETPQLPFNVDGTNGIRVYNKDLTTGDMTKTLGLRVGELTQGMNQINLAATLNGQVAAYGIGLRPGAVIKFEVLAGNPSELGITASTNAQSQGIAAIELIEQGERTATFTPGTYVAQSTTGGFAGAGDLTVNVVVSAHTIEHITVTEHHDTPNWFNRVDPWLINSVLLHQNTDVDVITSATYSSHGLLSAIDQALHLASNGR